MEMKIHQALSVHESHRATASARHVQRARRRTAGWHAGVDSFPSGTRASFGGVHAVGALESSLAKILVVVLRCIFGFVISFLQGPNVQTFHKRTDLKQTRKQL